MARASIDILGDSASAIAALDKVDASVTGLTATLDKAAASSKASSGEVTAALDAQAAGYEGLATKVETSTAAMVAASARRVETLKADAAAARELSAAYAAGSTEQQVSAAIAARKSAQANRLLGMEAAGAGPSFTQTAGTIGRGLTTYVTAPTAFIGYEAVKRALEFNQALLLIHTQAGASQAELEHMNQAVLQLVQSGHSYGQTAQSMAEGLYYIESEGIRGGQALSILQTAAAGAANGQTDMADTTNALTSAMKIFGNSAGGVAKTMATIDAVTATGKMHLEDLNNAFQTKFFTTAHQLGIPFEQAGAALDVFTKAGVPAQVAANNMTTSFIKMVTPAKAAIPYLAELGLTVNSLGQALQHGGLSEALGRLAAGYQHVEETQGKFAANKAVLESFGGSRSGAPALALVQQYQSYLTSLGEIQRLNDPANFWTRVAQTMQQPAMQIKQDVAEIGADFIKLGTALAPSVAALAGGITTVTNAFNRLPGPVKDAALVIVGILAVGGPVGLAIKGLGTLVGGLRTAFGMLTAEESLFGSRAVVVGAEARAAFASMLGPIALATAAVYGLDKAIAKLTGFDAIKKAWGSAGFFADNAHDAIAKPGSKNPFPQGTAAYYEWEAGAHGMRRGTHSFGGVPINVDPSSVYYKQGARARQRQHSAGVHHHAGMHGPSYTYSPVSAASSSTTYALPPHYQVELARAQAGVGNVTQEADQVRSYLLREIHSGSLSGKELAGAYRELHIVNNLLASDTRKAATEARKTEAAFKRRVSTDDQELAQARLDIANGELGAARRILEKDRERLLVLLQEAQNSDERTAVLRQLGTVTRMLHTKSDQFALSPKLQEEIARADALAALDPGLAGPTALQIQLAKQAKEAALRAIHSHQLTLQGLIAAWQIVGQENSILAQGKGAIDTYHAVSTDAITDSVKGLTAVQDMQLRERLAQAEAHRGYAPNDQGSGSNTGHGGGRLPQLAQQPVQIDVRLIGDLRKIISAVETHQRFGQRAGGRR